MRAKEFIAESRTGKINNEIAKKPKFRVIVYELIRENNRLKQGKSKTLQAYENGHKMSLEEFTEKLENKIKEL
jgi:hypothetical protein